MVPKLVWIQSKTPTVLVPDGPLNILRFKIHTYKMRTIFLHLVLFGGGLYKIIFVNKLVQ